MAFTYRVVVKYGVPLGARPQDPETYWLSIEEVGQLLEDVLRHYENTVEGPRVGTITITTFGKQSGLQREQLFRETGY